MFFGTCAKRNHMSRYHRHSAARAAFKSSGNMAFDSYKGETLRRLEEEQKNFEGFLQRLRESKDKSEFDDFMEDRARHARTTNGDDGGADDSDDGDEGKDAA